MLVIQYLLYLIIFVVLVIFVILKICPRDLLYLLDFRLGAIDPEHNLLTFHVEFDRSGHRHRDVVVRGLAREDGVQILALEVADHQLVDHASVVLVVEGAVEEGVIPPPRDRGHGTSAQGLAAQPERVAEVIRAEF